MKRQKRVAVINDVTGFGRCSAAVAQPIISAMKIQCCVMPTAILSVHTGFPNYFLQDYTPYLRTYMNSWEETGIEFDGITTGFIGSKEQIGLVVEFFKRFKKENTLAVVDPVMGDRGETYKTYSEALCEKMRTLAPSRIVITGLQQGDLIFNYIFEKNKTSELLSTRKIGGDRSGTGDVFSSIVTGALIQGQDFKTAVKRAVTFLDKAIAYTAQMELPWNYGICFEEYLEEI